MTLKECLIRCQNAFLYKVIMRFPYNKLASGLYENRVTQLETTFIFHQILLSLIILYIIEGLSR